MDDETRRRAASGAGITGRTKSERILWSLLRSRPPGWLCEVPTGPYRLDFYCPELRLAVEVDGPSHWGKRASDYDFTRDQWHLQHGIRTLRYSSREVEHDPHGVVAMIEQQAARRRLELRIMPSADGLLPADLPMSVPTQPVTSRASRRLLKLRFEGNTPDPRRRAQARRRYPRREPSLLGAAVALIAVFAFANNWLGFQTLYDHGAQHVATQAADAITQPLRDQDAAGFVRGSSADATARATVCPGEQPTCGKQVPASRVPGLMLQFDSAPRAVMPTPPCAGPVLRVSFTTTSGTTPVDVFVNCDAARNDRGQTHQGYQLGATIAALYNAP